jgi:hypothetical protein
MEVVGVQLCLVVNIPQKDEVADVVVDSNVALIAAISASTLPFTDL